MSAMSALRFDMRLAPFSAITQAEQYRLCLEMSTWADRRPTRG